MKGGKAMYEGSENPYTHCRNLRRNTRGPPDRCHLAFLNPRKNNNGHSPQNQITTKSKEKE